LPATAETYAQLCEGKLSPTGQSPRIESFYRELVQRWPEIDTVPDDKIDDHDFCPWSCALDHSGMHVIASCVWSKADAVTEFFEELAGKHGLVFYDPQADRVKTSGTASPAKKKWFGIFG
jgi:hypothetical protein